MPNAPISGVPSPRTPLVGRNHALAAARDILLNTDNRLLTLTGVGGSGKTRMALRLATDLAPVFPQRVWLVELAPVTDADLVPIVVATTIGLRDIESTSPLAALSAFLATQPALLVLDNCEHLIDACANLADALLRSCPDLRMITTSRESLLIAGERQYHVPPLETPDPNRLPSVDEISASPAVELFVARARDVSPAFLLTAENASLVARICARLGGIPLALELAAARVGVLGVEQILARLDDSFQLLTGGSRVAPTRHQTLKAALDWSDDLLSETERAVFRQLSVFAGEFQLGTVEAVCSSVDLSSADVLDALAGLANKSLVVAVSGDRDAWYHLLEPVRQYAAGHLEKSGEAAEARARHAHAYVAMAERAARELRGPNQDIWLVNLEREQGNLRAVLEWIQKRADAALALRFATALISFWETHGHLIEGQYWLRQALALPSENVDPALRMRALRGAGRLAFLHADDSGLSYAHSETLQRESLELAQAIGDRHGVASALTELGMVYRLQRDLVRSREALTKSLDQFRELGDEPGVALALLNLGAAGGHLGGITEAGHLMAESLERFRALGDLRSIGIAQVLLSRLALRQGDIEEATRLSIDAISAHARLADRWFVAFDLMSLAEVLLAHECRHDAIRLLGAAVAMRETLGSSVGGVTFSELFTKIDTLRQEDWFQTAWDEGHALDFEAALQVAHATQGAPPLQHQATRSVQPGPSLLTRRELQVAQLLALGYSDQRIAEELYVSAGTVGVHVHHILGKLNLRSRSKVAAWLEANEQRHPVLS